MRIRICFIYFLIVNSLLSIAQDPHYTQFSSAPFLINPAFTGSFQGKIRFLMNHRQQWNNLIDPYITTSAAMDVKIGSSEVVGQNRINLGLQFLNDKSMKGAFISNNFGSSVSYHVPLDEDGYSSLGLGLSGAYSNRTLNFGSISFDQQFTNDGFNLSLPSGESSLQNMKPFISVGAGILYIYNNTEEGSFVEVGISGYHFNKPKQTFNQGSQEFLPVRISLQANFQKYINDQIIIGIQTLYQNQAAVQYVSGGVSLSKIFGGDKNVLFGGGFFYRSLGALSPHVLLELKKMQLGVSYDVFLNKFKNGSVPARSIEFSVQMRFGESE
jgi:type IX secretion system PorP/SprF family membrane protein